MIALREPTVALASSADRSRLVDILTRSFATDPPCMAFSVHSACFQAG
jgi:hypothetical protein